MKLSKQERIAAIVVIVLVILVAGTFIFIKPNIEEIIATKESLEAKKQEYDDDVARANTKDALKQQILKEYNDGKNLADMFFPELKAYEVDNEFRAFFAQVSNRENLHIDSIKVSDPGTAGLSASVFTPTETQYALKNYVAQSDEAAADGNLLRQRMIQAYLGEPQTIGASTVSFDLYAASIQDLFTFADEVNNYELTVNGKTVRKAIELNGVSFSDSRVKYLLEKRGTEAMEDAVAAGNKAFSDLLAGNARIEKITNAEPAAPADAPAAPSSGSADDEYGVEMNDDEELPEFYLHKLSCTITFYSIERMSDPTPILAEQDKAV